MTLLRAIVAIARRLSVLLSMFLMAACVLRSMPFEGDATLSDRGYWSYSPRYKIDFPGFSLREPGEYLFRFRGVPDVALSLTLPVQSDLPDTRLKTVTTWVDAQLANGSGKPVCEATGALKDWVLMSSSTQEQAYWQKQCTELRLRNDEWYSLRVRVTNIEALSATTKITPRLSGGGWDSL